MSQKKRYRVFVSSTYEDLRQVRQTIMQNLLSANFIPAGMEWFAASHLTSLELIKRDIDDSDYYVVVSAGLYGSIGPDGGPSYTELEYRYAMEKEIPTIGFLHANTGSLPKDLCESDPERIRKLSDFQNLIKSKQCAFYTNPDELAARVLASLTNVINVCPRQGWIRGNKDINQPTSNGDLIKTTDLACGDEIFYVHYTYEFDAKYMDEDGKIRNGIKRETFLGATWTELFKLFGPIFDPPIQLDVIPQYVDLTIQNKYSTRDWRQYSVSVNQADIQRVFNQFKALKYIHRIPNDNWKLTLTDFGFDELARLTAIPSKKST